MNAMSEMLGNQYFIARKYYDAAEELELALLKDPANKAIKKKLIICYIQTKKIKDALNIFYQLVEEDLHFILYSNPVRDDCPCQEIIYKIENDLGYTNDYERSLVLGMLWLYCDINESIKYFKIATSYNNEDVLSRLSNKLLETSSQLNKKE